jgi:hypothetical protein
MILEGNILFPLLIDIIFLGAMFFLGIALVRGIKPGYASGFIPWIAFPLGVGCFSWVLFLLSWLGVRHSLSTSLFVYSALMIPLLLRWLRYTTGEHFQVKNLGKTARQLLKSPGRILLFGIGLVMVITSALISTGLAYSTWDAIAIYAVKGYGIALEGTILAGNEWGALGLSRPLNVPILISLFRILDGDILPGSKLVFSLFLASILGGVYVFWTRQRVDAMVASLGTLFLGSLSIVFQHSTRGYTNLPFCVYLILGIMIGYDSIQRSDRSGQLWSGILLSLACWTRSEGALVIPILLLTLILIFRLQKKGTVFFLNWTLPVVVQLTGWFMFTQLQSGRTIIHRTMITALESSLTFNFHLDSIYTTLRYIGGQIFKVEIWGLIIPVVILVCLRNWRKIISRRSNESLAVLASAGVMGLSTLALYYLSSYTRDLRLQLETSADRFILPTGLLILIWAVMLSADQKHEDRGVQE